MAAPLPNKRLLFVSGKGGTGKSTVAAAAAVAWARRGERVLLVQVHATDRMGALFGRPPVGPEIVPLEEGIDAVNMQPEAVRREYGLMVLRFRAVYNAVFENRLVRHFLRVIPSLGEAQMLGKIWYHERERDPEDPGRPRFDRLIVDCPATGHAIAFLRVARTVEAAAPGGTLREIAGDLRRLLEDKERTGLVIVTLPEEMPVTEALELARSAEEELSMARELLVVNAMPQPPFGPGQEQTWQEIRALAATDPVLAQLTAAAEFHLARWQLAAEQRDRALAGSGTAAQVELPRLSGDRLGRQDLDRLADLLLPLAAGEPALGRGRGDP